MISCQKGNEIRFEATVSSEGGVAAEGKLVEGKYTTVTEYQIVMWQYRIKIGQYFITFVKQIEFDAHFSAQFLLRVQLIHATQCS